MDFSPVSFGWGVSVLSKWTRESSEVRERLEPLVKKWPGAILEVKGPDLSLHYRGLDPEKADQLIAQALDAVEDLSVIPNRGKCVLEFEPQGAPGKGEALERLAKGYFMGNDGGFCMYVGDDRTDEEAFVALRHMRRRAVGFKVGPGSTHAHFRLRNVEEVHRLLTSILDTRKGGENEHEYGH
jgi:trehalose 6-phosphate phosphatase